MRKTQLEPTVLFYAINGAGLGHLTRCLSIARRMRDVQPVFITTCKRANVLDQYGIAYRYVPSLREAMIADPGVNRHRWHRDLTKVVEELFDEYHPAAVVSDTIAVDRGLLIALRLHFEVGRMEIRREYRLDGRELLVKALDREFHELLVPHREGETAIPLPKGPRARWVGPLVIVGKEEALSREAARAELGLPSDRPCILLQLGAGEIGGGKIVEERLLEALRDRHDLQAVVTAYDAEPGAAAAPYFPLAKVLPAFDMAVAASGYNTYVELMHHGIPTIFVPNEQTISDDQVARARRAADAGAAIVVPESQPAAVVDATLALADDPGKRARMGAAASALIPVNGADEAARAVEEFCLAVLTV